MTHSAASYAQALGFQEIPGRYAGSQQNQHPHITPSADMESLLERAREMEWARGLIHKLAPNARSAEWWFTEKPINIIAGAILDREKPGPK